MPAIVRVKRRIDEEPLSAFVLNGKKRRLEDGKSAASAEFTDNYTSAAEAATASNDASGKDEISTILKFAGTLNEQDNNATTQFARLTKDAAKELVQQKTRARPTNHTERARQEMRTALHENRFRIVNCLRTTLEDESTAVAGSGAAAAEFTGASSSSIFNGTNTLRQNSKEITIFDIERQNDNQRTNDTTNSTATAMDALPELTNVSLQQQQQPHAVNSTIDADDEAGYVYDLYLPENEQQAANVDLMDDNYLSVRAFDDLIYEDRYNNDDDEDNDSEDSNQENHYANDYPDEDDEFEYCNDGEDNESDGEREMRRAVEQFMFADDDDDDDEEGAEYVLSSDDEDHNPYQDPYVHTTNANEDSFIDDVDYCDIERYGMAYARYKARILKQLKQQQNKSLDSDDDEDDEHSNSDDDDDDDDNKTNERYHSANEKLDCYD